MSFILPPTDHEEMRLHHKRAWLRDQIERAMRKRRYPHLIPEDDPRYPLWRKVVVDGVAVIYLVITIGIVALIAHAGSQWWMSIVT